MRLLAALTSACLALSLAAPRLTYRNMRADDVPRVAALCRDSFDFSAQFEKELQHRHESLVLRGYKHCMLVAEDPASGAVVGFTEIGLLPSPAPLAAVWGGADTEATVDVPYLGNLCVDPDYRRQRIGSRLATISRKVVEKWGDCSLYAAVAMDNLAARRMYEGLGFSLCLDESQLLSRRATAPPRLFFAKAWEPSPRAAVTSDS